MFIAFYQFTVLPGRQDDFRKAWRQLTELIYQYENSLGSRLHSTADPTVFLAYAQWPDRATWENSGDHLPPAADAARQLMRASTSEIKTLHTMQTEDDLLATQPFGRTD